MGLLRHFFIWLLRSALCLWGKYGPTDGYANDEFQLWGIEGFSHHQLVPRFRIKESQVFLDDNLTITVCVCLTKMLIPKITTDTSSANSSKNRYVEKFIKKRNWATVVACEETADKIEYTSISHHARIVSKLPTNETTWKHCSSLPRKSA
mgnify:CR=1 FL=1